MPGVTQTGSDSRDSYPDPLVYTLKQVPTTALPEASTSGSHRFDPLPKDCDYQRTGPDEFT